MKKKEQQTSYHPGAIQHQRGEREPLPCQPRIMFQMKSNLDLTFSSSPIHYRQDKNSAGKKASNYPDEIILIYCEQLSSWLTAPDFRIV